MVLVERDCTSYRSYCEAALLHCVAIPGVGWLAGADGTPSAAGGAAVSADAFIGCAFICSGLLHSLASCLPFFESRSMPLAGMPIHTSPRLRFSNRSAPVVVLTRVMPA